MEPGGGLTVKKSTNTPWNIPLVSLDTRESVHRCIRTSFMASTASLGLSSHQTLLLQRRSNQSVFFPEGQEDADDPAVPPLHRFQLAPRTCCLRINPVRPVGFFLLGCCVRFLSCSLSNHGDHLETGRRWSGCGCNCTDTDLNINHFIKTWIRCDGGYSLKTHKTYNQIINIYIYIHIYIYYCFTHTYSRIFFSFVFHANYLIL